MKNILLELSAYSKEVINNSELNNDEIIDTLNKIAETNSILSQYLRGRLDPLRIKVFKDQLELWANELPTTPEFKSLFRRE